MSGILIPILLPFYSKYVKAAEYTVSATQVTVTTTNVCQTKTDVYPVFITMMMFNGYVPVAQVHNSDYFHHLCGGYYKFEGYAPRLLFPLTGNGYSILCDQTPLLLLVKRI